MLLFIPQDLLVLLLVDVVHIEKNIYTTFFKIFFNCKEIQIDYAVLQKSMQYFGLMHNFYPKEDGLYRESNWI